MHARREAVQIDSVEADGRVLRSVVAEHFLACMGASEFQEAPVSKLVLTDDKPIGGFQPNQVSGWLIKLAKPDIEQI